MIRAGDSRWFRRVANEFCPLMSPFAGTPVNYVEIGCWEGASAEWVARNILTHPESRGFGIDPYDGVHVLRHSDEVMQSRCEIAARRLAFCDRWQWIRSTSQQALRSWMTPIDILYIDGQHEAPYVLADFVLAWPHLRVPGLVIFDDWAIGLRKRFPCVPEAVRAIERTFAGLVEPARPYGRQAALRILKKNVDTEWFQTVRVARGAAKLAAE